MMPSVFVPPEEPGAQVQPPEASEEAAINSGPGPAPGECCSAILEMLKARVAGALIVFQGKKLLGTESASCRLLISPPVCIHTALFFGAALVDLLHCAYSF